MSNNGKVVMVTGASRGIGRATAKQLAQAGYRLIITARGGQSDAPGAPQGDALESAAQELRALGAEVLAVPMDLLDLDSVEKAAQTVAEHYGQLDLLINNAIYQGRDMHSTFEELTVDSLQRSLLGNTVAPFLLTQRLLPLIKQSGGMIINMTSNAGEVNPPMSVTKGGWGFAYGASKGGFSRMGGIINIEQDEPVVLALTANPGVVLTESLRATLGDDAEMAQRYGAVEPVVIARTLQWLYEHREAASTMTSRTIQLQKVAKENELI